LVPEKLPSVWSGEVTIKFLYLEQGA
jgi:hypothetical protein